MKFSKSEWGYVDIWFKKIKAINILGGKCEKCGDQNIFHLVFHHKFDKRFEMHDEKTTRWTFLEKEINKCVLLCRNCHSELHTNLAKDVVQKERNEKIKIKLLCLKGVDCCQECGYKGENGASLVFHHIGEKKFWVNTVKVRLKINKVENLLLEIDKCVVLCQNCHSEKHTDIEKFNILKDKIYNKLRSGSRENKPLDIREVKKLYDEGNGVCSIAKKMNRNKSTICWAIKKLKKDNNASLV